MTASPPIKMKEKWIIDGITDPSEFFRMREQLQIYRIMGNPDITPGFYIKKGARPNPRGRSAYIILRCLKSEKLAIHRSKRRYIFTEMQYRVQKTVKSKLFAEWLQFVVNRYSSRVPCKNIVRVWASWNVFSSNTETEIDRHSLATQASQTNIFGQWVVAKNVVVRTWIPQMSQLSISWHRSTGNSICIWW